MSIASAVKLGGIPALDTPQWLSSTLSTLQDVATSIPSVGRELLNAKDPDNYELYKMLIQVVDASPLMNENPLVLEFEFTIMPEDVSVIRQYKTAVIPTLSGNFIMDSIYEAPSQFTMRGTFGVNHKAMINVGALQSNVKQNGVEIKLSKKTKLVALTGYGLVKRLENIIKLSKGSNGVYPYRTYLINLAFNSAIQIEFNKVVFRQNVQRNGMWQYDFSATKVSDDYAYANSLQKTTTQILREKVLSTVASNLGAPLYNQLFASTLKYV